MFSLLNASMNTSSSKAASNAPATNKTKEFKSTKPLPFLEAPNSAEPSQTSAKPTRNNPFPNCLPLPPMKPAMSQRPQSSEDIERATYNNRATNDALWEDWDSERDFRDCQRDEENLVVRWRKQCGERKEGVGEGKGMD